MKPLRISIQGDAASFHDIAAGQFFGEGHSRVFCGTFEETLAALQEGKADFALCAIENSLYGSINEVYDLLLEHKLQIVGEVYLRIEQCLIGLPGTTLRDITHVYSHPIALAQCEEYLEHTLINAERVEHHDTAASVEYIMQLGDKANAAIASKQSAELHGAEVIAESIETNKENYTRFVVIGQPNTLPEQELNKTSLVFSTDHKPGALYDALGCFAKRSINLSKIQSRPIVGKAWHYVFYVDVDAGMQHPDYQACIDELKQQGCEVTMLGSYASGRS